MTMCIYTYYKTSGPREMVQELRVLIADAEGPGSVSSTHMVAHNCLQVYLLASDASLRLPSVLHAHGVPIVASQTLLYLKTKLS